MQNAILSFRCFIAAVSQTLQSVIVGHETTCSMRREQRGVPCSERLPLINRSGGRRDVRRGRRRVWGGKWWWWWKARAEEE
jgi:hypothetical protein